MPTTPKTPRKQRVARIKTVKDSVDKQWAQNVWRLLTGCYRNTDSLFTVLLTACTEAESSMPASRQAMLKMHFASVWECARYGWHCAAFGRFDNADKLTFATTSRRLRVLCRRAVDCGVRIARAQADGTADLPEPS
jgi:hypothetical protein